MVTTMLEQLIQAALEESAQGLMFPQHRADVPAIAWIMQSENRGRCDDEGS